jgi:hypothetical protein
MIENEDALLVAKEPAKGRMRYMARYGAAKTLICQIKGQRIVEIYERRGFVEIGKEEYRSLAASMKEKV